MFVLTNPRYPNEVFALAKTRVVRLYLDLHGHSVMKVCLRL